MNEIALYDCKQNSSSIFDGMISSLFVVNLQVTSRRFRIDLLGCLRSHVKIMFCLCHENSPSPLLLDLFTPLGRLKNVEEKGPQNVREIIIIINIHYYLLSYQEDMLWMV